MFSTQVVQQVDKWVLFWMNRSLPDSFEDSYQNAPSFDEVLAGTWVDEAKTAVYALTAPGKHTITLHTPEGERPCYVHVRPAKDPAAPLVLYHHGLNEWPPTGSWQRIFPVSDPFPAHSVCIQAPYHDQWRAPFEHGFVSLQTVYQMFACSLRMMALMQTQFEAEGAPFTIASGVSWGGITSIMYEGLFRQTRAVVPMLSSPNLAQVMWDIAALFDRSIAIPKSQLQELLDFTHYYERCDPSRVFPLVGEYDVFFQLANHWNGRTLLTTIPHSHISGMWQAKTLRQHLLNTLQIVS
jgi:hypothetical protein